MNDLLKCLCYLLIIVIQIYFPNSYILSTTYKIVINVSGVYFISMLNTLKHEGFNSINMKYNVYPQLKIAQNSNTPVIQI